MATAFGSLRPAFVLCVWAGLSALRHQQGFAGLTLGKESRSRLRLRSQAAIEQNIQLIEELRQDRSAPVDSMGIHVIRSQAKDPCYETLVALILSARTKDATTFSTIQVLREHGLTPANILATPVSTLTSLIARVNHHKKKAIYIKEMTAMLLEEFNGKFPDTEAELRRLKGVGEKSALLYLQTVKGQAHGIAVDSHLHSIANSLGWVKTKRAPQTRRELEEILPSRWWTAVNPLVVGFGQEMATEKSKILAKCLNSSNPSVALQMLSKCGMNVTKELAKRGQLDSNFTNFPTLQ